MRFPSWFTRGMVLVPLWLGGCSFIVGGQTGPLDTGQPLVELSPETPRRGDSIVATASGSADPRGSEISYRFEWALSDVEQANTAPSSDTLRADLIKGQQWTLRVTPVAVDGREGPASEVAFAVVNTAPTIETVALSSYQPAVDQRVQVDVVGYEDVDGDAWVPKFRWHLGSRDPIETSTGEIDLASLSPAIEPDTEQLIVEAVPFDGEDDNLDGTLSLGPFSFLDDVTQWRAMQPSHAGGLLNFGTFITWDPTHRRFLRFGGDGLWEYTSSHGFAQLPAGGAPPPANRALTPVYDGTPGAEQFFVLGVTGLDPRYAVYILDVHARGQEEWTTMMLDPGPVPKNFFSTHFDRSSRHLMMIGGNAFGPPDPSNELWLLDLSDPMAPAWTDESPFKDVFTATSGATAVTLPSLPNQVMLFGGWADEAASPSPIQRIEYDLSDPSSPLFAFTALDDTLTGAPLGPMVVADPERDLIVGGLGVDPSFESVDRVWVYDPSSNGGSGSLVFRGTDLPFFSELDTSLGALLGVGGWDGDHILFWPGASSAFANYFRLGEIQPPAQQGETYAWRSFLRPGVDFPQGVSQAATDGAIAVIATAYPDDTPLFEFGFATDKLVPNFTSFDPSPGIRARLWGGQSTSGGLWMVSGELQSTDETADMQAWRYANDALEAPNVATPMPAPREQHMIFDPGCGSQTPVGVFGGQSDNGMPMTDETWLLRCPLAEPHCDWESVDGSSPGALLQPAIVSDGHGNVILFGGLEGTSVSGDVYVLDACEIPPTGWALAEVTADPTHGSPAMVGHTMVRLPEASSPEFLVVKTGGSGTVWLLRETAPLSYAWQRVVDVVGTAPLASKMTWDNDHRRMLGFSDHGAVWELRYRP